MRKGCLFDPGRFGQISPGQASSEMAVIHNQSEVVIFHCSWERVSMVVQDALVWGRPSCPRILKGRPGFPSRPG
jgi:hypothetical protein